MPQSENKIIKLGANKPVQADNQTGKPAAPAVKRARTLAITSGKGGVGKSNVATNLAVTLAQKGAKVCIFDADTNLANVNILMGLTPKFSIHHVLNGVKTIDEVLVTGPGNVSIIPAASGIAEANDFNETQKKRLLDAIETLEQRFDYLLIDTAAGISDSVIRFLRSAEAILLVISTEPTSLTDAFALLRVLKRSGYTRTTHVLVNMAINFGNGMEIFKRFDGAVKKYLKLPLNFIGYITDDIAVRDSVRQQCPVVLYRPDSLASRCFNNIERVLLSHLNNTRQTTSFSSFWKKALLPEKDSVIEKAVSKILNKPVSQQHGSRDKLINYISSAELDRKDILQLIFKLLEKMHSQTAGAAHDDKESSQLLTQINDLLIRQSKEIQQLYSNDLVEMSERLITTGNKLEASLDKLINELESQLEER